nr:hypothetical protein [Caballeronia sp. ATUFL_M2_KS44]
MAQHEVLDGFGHVSVRDPRNPEHFLIAQSMAPERGQPQDILTLTLPTPLKLKRLSGVLHRERTMKSHAPARRPLSPSRCTTPRAARRPTRSRWRRHRPPRPRPSR